MEIAGESFNVRIDGAETAPPVVLSNSLGTDLTMWDAQAAELAKSFRVIRYDSRGHGGSVANPGPYSIERLGRDVLAILDALGIERTHWIGLSMGGMVGQWLLAEHGRRFDRAVLANTASHYPDPRGWNARIALVRAKGMEPVVEGSLQRWFTPDFLRGRPTAADSMAAVLRSLSPEGYASCCAAIRDMDLRESNRKIKNPTLVIAGARDEATPPALGRELADRIGGARVFEIDAAHLSNVERPDAFLRAVAEFISGS